MTAHVSRLAALALLVSLATAAPRASAQSPESLAMTPQARPWSKTTGCCAATKVALMKRAARRVSRLKRWRDTLDSG